jgi:hypothetical protein
VGGYLSGLTLKEIADYLGERGIVITTLRLNSRLSAYTSYRRKKNLPQLFDRKNGKFTLSVYGKRVMADYVLESDFIRSVQMRPKVASVIAIVPKEEEEEEEQEEGVIDMDF